MAVNTAPTLGSTSTVLPDVDESATSPAAVSVASLLAGVGASDAEQAVSSLGVAITAVDSSLGTWQYSTDGAHWVTIDAAAINSTINEVALMLDASSFVRLLPFGDVNGSSSAGITFRAWDGTSGQAGTYGDLLTTNTTNGVSTAAATAAVTVVPVDDAPTFSSGNGTAAFQVGSIDRAFGGAVQPDGRIVVAGNADGVATLARLDASGAPDPTFNGTGIAHAPGTIEAVYLEPDGHIITAGSVNGNISLLRWNSDGSLDATFDSAPAASIAGTGVALTEQPDGSILVVNGAADSFMPWRFKPDGSLDATFNSGSDHSTGSPANSVALEADGLVLAAGQQHSSWAFRAWTADGTWTGWNLPGYLEDASTSIDPILAVQPDGKVLVGGPWFPSGGQWQFAVARFNADGSRDTSFGNTPDAQFLLNTGVNAKYTLVAPGALNNYAFGMALQPDGKIVLTGQSEAADGKLYLGVARVNSDGSLDTSFGSGGTEILNVGWSAEGATYATLVQPDGGIVIIPHSAVTGSNEAFTPVRLKPDGTLDTTFGAADTLGSTAIYVKGGAPVALDGSVSIHDVELDALAGGVGNYSGASLSIARHGGASADDLFSASGNLSFDNGGNAWLTDAQLGTSVQIGSVSNSAGTLTIVFNSNATQARVSEAISSLAYANGSTDPDRSIQLDWTFNDGNTTGAQGSGGAHSTTESSFVTISGVEHAPVLDTTVSPALAAVAEGASNPAGTSVSQLLAGASDRDADPIGAAITGLDTSLGTWQYSTDAGATWLTIDAGQINSATNELALLLQPTDQVRLLPFGDLNGSLPDAITFRAWDQTDGYSHGDYVAIAATGGATAFSSASAAASIVVTAVNEAPTFAAGSGSVLSTFGRDSITAYLASAAVAPDGSVLAGALSTTALGREADVVRVLSDGTPDAAFNANTLPSNALGYSDQSYSLALQADGKAVLAGSVGSYATGDSDLNLLRVYPDGSADTGFDTNTAGVLTDPNASVGPTALTAVQPDGKIVLAAAQLDGTPQLLVYRFNPDGTADSSFGTAGKVYVTDPGGDDSPTSLLLQPDGSVVVIGQYGTAVRVLSDGSLDAAFDANASAALSGAVALTGAGAALQGDGKILVGGLTQSQQAVVVRLNVDGKPDTSFGASGNGSVPVATGPLSAVDLDIATQPDGKIVLSEPLIRLNADGTVDSTFDSTAALASLNVAAMTSSVTVQPDGKIAAVVTDSGGAELGVLRLNADGSLDTSFGHSANTLGNTVPYTAGTAAVALDPTASIRDAELAALAGGAGDYDGASVTLARDGGASSDDLFSGAGNLTLTGGKAMLGTTQIGTADLGSSPGTLTITFNGNATQAAVNEALSSIAYANASANAAGRVQIDWTFSDGNTGAQGSGGALTATGSTTVNMTGLNDAPVLDPSVIVAMPSVREGSGPSVAAVASLLGGATDAENALGMAITAVDTSLGTWQYSIDGGTTWRTIDAAALDSTTNELALVLNATDDVRLLPFGHLNGTVTDGITFRAWDGSDGSTQGSYVTIGATGGSSAFSSASDTVAAHVSAVNDAPTFDAGPGKAMYAVGSNNAAYSVAVQPDGNIVFAGAADSIQTVVRLSGAGTLDGSFNGSGMSQLALGGAASYVASVALQADGEILGVGRYDKYVSLLRWNSDGSPDIVFDRAAAAAALPGWGKAIAVQTDGKILVVNGAGVEYSVDRFNPDGSLDTTFNSAGGATAGTVSVGSGIAQAVAVQADGKILLAGDDFSDPTGAFGVVRLNPDGSLDTTFGNGTGEVAINAPNGAAASIVVQPDGEILVAGTANGTNSEAFAVVRLQSDGSLDTSFGSGGMAAVVAGTTSMATAMAMQPDGKIVVAGTAWDGSGAEGFAVARLNADGSVDSSFGGSGTGTQFVGIGSNGGDIGYGLALQPDGKLVVVGRAADASLNNEFGIARLNPDGSLDTSFRPVVTLQPLGGSGTNGAGSGKMQFVPYTENAPPVALDSHAAIYDADLAALADGQGNYSGASVTLARQGGASSDDLFSGLGPLSLAGGTAVLSGTAIGTVTTNAGGTLSITFNSHATQAAVNEALANIGYANASDNPQPSVDIIWTFSDGNTGAQGSGGALTATGGTSVAITAVDDAPVLATPLVSASVQVGSALSYVVPSNTFTDVDGPALSYTATLADGSALPSWLTFDPVSRSFGGTPPTTGDWVTDYAVQVTASDGTLSASDTFHLYAVDASQQPSTAVPLPTVPGISGADVTATAAGSFQATGGTSTLTALPNALVLDAPAGATVVTPLTTLIDVLVQQGMTAQAANDAVLQAFGLPSGLNLATYDPLATGGTTGLQVEIAGVQAATTATLSGNASGALQALASAIAKGGVNLADAQFVQQLLGSTVSGTLAATIAQDNAALALSSSLAQLSQAEAGALAHPEPGLVVVGTDGADQLTGGAGTDSITALAGRDTVVATSGNDVIHGGDGVDTVVYAGAHTGFAVAAQTDGSLVVSGSGGVQLLDGVERLQFDDISLAFDFDGAAGQVYRLYRTALDREPDLGGMGYQLHDVETKYSLEQVANNFIHSPEFQARYGSLDDLHFVEMLYENALHRPGEQAGIDYHMAELAAGLSRADLLLHFSESPEFKADVIGSIQNGIAYLPFTGTP